MDWKPWTLLIALLTAPLAAAAEPPSDRDLLYEDRIAELERTVRTLAEELERTRADVTVPEEPELVGSYGMGPAASKVYGVARGLSIGGYGEGFYKVLADDAGGGRDRADLLRSVLYVGYKFSERFVFNSEIEFEHATTSSTESSGAGSVSVELAALDFLWQDWANLRGGLLLVPMGFLNEIHEPPFFYGVDRPDVEQVIIPSTWGANGAGLFGSLGESLEYKLYAVGGLNARGFDAGGLRGGRQKGNRTLAEHGGAVARLDWSPREGALLGASVFTGQSGQNQTLATAVPGVSVGVPDSWLTLFDLHGQWRWQGLHLRGLFSMGFLENARALTLALRQVPEGSSTELGATEVIADTLLGGYAEIAYDVMRLLSESTEMSLEPFYRYEYYDTQFGVPSGFLRDRSREIQVHSVGASFRPIPNIVLKADFRGREAKRGRIADEVNLGIGYVF